MTKHRRTMTSMLYGMLALAILSALILAAPNAHATTIDPHRKGSLSITKSSGDPLTQYGDPHNPLAPLTREPIAGVTFTIQQINVDLTTNEGWQELQSLNKNELAPAGAATGKLLPGTQLQATTSNDGIARFYDLKIGAYYVTEIPTTASEKHLSVIDPFVITIPVTIGNDTWDYDVHAFAKDQKIMATKTTNNEYACTGDTITFGITTTLPAPNTEGKITRVDIVDPLNANLTYNPDNTHVYLTNTNAKGDKLTLAAQDYRITNQANILTVALSEAGLQRVASLRTGRPDLQLNVEFSATITNLNHGQKLSNKGYVLPTGYPEFDPKTTPGIPTNDVIITCQRGTGDRPHIPALALTGAHTLWALVAGAILITGGLVLVRRNTTNTSGTEK
ncbi:MAG: SpaH/EbpB family LPXTG-anchored major pilin [Corynebacterium sp.]|uniref:SpaH/EbpB family LPXTG-anchored major pilin n=1 Tax=Corynebacterium sp. TaxID=1720 RepID=UPI0026DCF36D|nr:SpaH/EbpB family LPXTG-anchored major pilin [Corynebacterium sp.]MDO4761477.1 SpaH/EbpB family LPXTG-anchored major pilin [Corynebacterium sp.]